LKVVANFSVDSKVFNDQISVLKKMALEGNENALFCIKNMGYNLDEKQAKYYHTFVDF